MSQRTDALADRLEGGARALAEFAATLTDEEYPLTDEELDRAAPVPL